MGQLYVDTIEPQSGTSLTIGESGQHTDLAGNDIRANVLQDAGGNAILTSNGSGTLSGVNSGFGSAMSVLSTTTVSSAVASVSFTSGIDSTYKQYMVTWWGVHGTTADTDWLMQGSIDGGSNYNVSTTTTTWRGWGKSDGSNPNINAWQAQPAWDVNNSTSFFPVAPDYNPTSSTVHGRLIIFDPSSTTYYKPFWTDVITTLNSGDTNAMWFRMAGHFQVANSAINALSFKFDSPAANIDAGIFKLWGIK